MWGPPVSTIPFPTPADRCHFSSSLPATPHRPAPPSDAARAVTHPTIISPPPPLNPFLTSPLSSMALKSLTPPLLPPSTPLQHSRGPYKRVMRPPDLTAPPHCTLSPLPQHEHRCRRALPPPPFPPPSPGRHTAARTLVRPEPSSPCSPLSVAHPPVSFRAPEWPEAILW
jgi:hypothetical protein